MAAGKVEIGYSKPYVALYSVSGSTVTYSSGQLLARGVGQSTSIDTSDNNDFYADNIVAESEGGVFNGGTLTLTVDGLLQSSEKLIMGLAAADTTTGMIAYGDSQNIPDVGYGAVLMYQSDGVVSYTPIIYPRVRFNQIDNSANTKEENKDWQTQELTATIKRAEDADRHWKYIGGEALATESAAEAKIKTFFGIA